MGFADICCSIACRIGEFTGKSHNALSSAQKKLKESAQALNPKNLPERIQKAIYEKLTRTLYKQAEFMMGKLSERMEVIDEVARPFYEKINALAAHGPVSETRLWDVMNSIEAAKKLTEEEKALLVTLFGQIVGAQKSKVVDAIVVERSTLTGESNPS
ncbi:hypothetical protein ACFL3G_06380 [Planctomycetota bacterium]